MALDFSLDPAQHLVLGNARGVLTDADLSRYQDALLRDPRFHPTMDQLLNCTAVTRMRVSATMLRQIAQASPFGPGSRRAIVAPSIETFGYARMFQALLWPTRTEIAIFNDLPTALRFLGRDHLILVPPRRSKFLPTQRAIFRIA